jgi:hypothetical protein
MPENKHTPNDSTPNSIILIILVAVLMVVLGLVASVFFMGESTTGPSDLLPAISQQQPAPEGSALVIPPQVRKLIDSKEGKLVQESSEPAAQVTSQKVLGAKHLAAGKNIEQKYKRISAKNPGSFEADDQGNKLPHPTTSKARFNAVQNAKKPVMLYKGVDTKLDIK